MKPILLLILVTLWLALTLLSCDDEVTALAAIQDRKQLAEGTRVDFLLLQNSPNPFNFSTSIEFQIAVTTHLTLKIYTDDWQEVRILIDDMFLPGVYEVVFDGKDADGKVLPSGEYFYTLSGNGLTQVRKMKLLK